MSMSIHVSIKGMHDAVGRVDYITNPNRQENLLAIAGKTDLEFWQHLSADAQDAFLKSGGAREKTIRVRNKKTGEIEERVVRKKAEEARELMVVLPKNVLRWDADSQKKVAEDFAKFLKEKYGLESVIGLHESKTENNIHLHAMFPERELLPEPEIKIADRNVFLDEYGVRKRTKKEILDEDCKLRSGCRIVPKGEIISKRYFGVKEEMFYSKEWGEDCKRDIAEWINERLQPDVKRVVFDPNGPYLAQQKIGKGRPEAQVNRIKNYNMMVKAFNELVRKEIIEEEYAQKLKTNIMIAPDRVIALSSVLASFSSREAGEIIYNNTWLSCCSNSELDKIETHPGKARTNNGPDEEKKRKLRELYHQAAITRQKMRSASDEEFYQLRAEARQISAHIDRLRKELGYYKEEEYLRSIRRKKEKMSKTRSLILNNRSRISSLKQRAYNKVNYIMYLEKRLHDMPVFFLTKEQKAEKIELEKSLKEANEQLDNILQQEAEARLRYKQLKVDLKEQKKALREEKREAKAAKNSLTDQIFGAEKRVGSSGTTKPSPEHEQGR